MAAFAVADNHQNRHHHLQHQHQQQPDMNHNDLDQHADYPSGDVATDRPALPSSSPIQQHEYADGNALSNNSIPVAQPGPAPPLIRNTAPPGHFDMLPPPNSTHASWQALHDYAQSHASEHGYALSINTTAKNRSRIKLACVCYGQPKNTHKLTPETRVRKNRVSYKTGCKMWIEGKRAEDGTWVLRVGEPDHNHVGRASEGWAVQRKRTWGVVGGRIGVGGVTAKEESARRTSVPGKAPHVRETGEDDDEVNDGEVSPQQPKANHSLERGGPVWKIVEQEMLRKGEPNQGRDRGVGRTVQVLQARLPGIHIFKRDVYNIRAQIKRARKAAGQQVGDGLNSDGDDAEGLQENDIHVEPESFQEPPAKQSSLQHDHQQQQQQSDQQNSLPTSSHNIPHSLSQIDPSLTAPDTSEPGPGSIIPTHSPLEPPEIARLVEENAELRRLLNERTMELKERTIELASLRSQIDFMMISR